MQYFLILGHNISERDRAKLSPYLFTLIKVTIFSGYILNLVKLAN